MRRDHAAEAASLELTALGVPVVVRVSGGRAGDAVEALREAWEWCPADAAIETTPAEPVVVDAFLDDDEAAVSERRSQGERATASLPQLMDWLTPAITTEAITRQAGSMLMLHACAVAHPESGAAAVLVGPAGIGKTTAARSLGRSLGYLTDETAAITSDNAVLPYPKPLSLRTQTGGGVKQQASPSSLGLVAPPAKAWAASLLLLDRSPDAPTIPAVYGVPTVRALAEIGQHASFLGRMPAPLQRMAEVLGDCGGLLRVTYREAADLTKVVGNLLEEAR